MLRGEYHSERIEMLFCLYEYPFEKRVNTFDSLKIKYFKYWNCEINFPVHKIKCINKTITLLMRCPWMPSAS